MSRPDFGDVVWAHGQGFSADSTEVEMSEVKGKSALLSHKLLMKFVLFKSKTKTWCKRLAPRHGIYSVSPLPLGGEG